MGKQKYVNEIRIAGKLGRDPKMFATASGGQMASFSVATWEKYSKTGDDKGTTEWHECRAFKEAAARIASLKKGDWVEVEGKIQTAEWTNREGIKVKTKEIVAFKVSMPDGETRKPEIPEHMPFDPDEQCPF